MNVILHKHHRWLFYSCWFILALAQSAATELIADEAYYWVYSHFLSWGYFDHPPMTALLIKWGYSFFQNELGVRLLCALLSTGTIFITEKLTERKNPFLFYTIVLGIGVLQIAGFLAVPDTPLLFFTALFFYCYRRFIQNINGKNAVWLGLVTALLFYSKYHGLLIVFFTLLSNIKLLRRWQTWLAGFCVLVFFAPHLLWQWENNWVSFRYHLFESNVSTYKFSYTTEYILGQLLLAGPLAGLILLPAAFLYKAKNETEKALKFTLLGVYAVFLLSSFRGKVEANWTMPVLIPMIILSHQFIGERVSWVKTLRTIMIISLFLIVVGRIYLVIDIGPENSVKKRFHYSKEWAKILAEKTGDRPVVFYNSYQRASLFWFYGKKPSHSLNDYRERRNNYNFWPTEDNLLGKPVSLADIYDMGRFTNSLKTKSGWTGWRPDTLFASLGRIRIIPEKRKFQTDTSKTLNIKFKREISRQYIFFLLEHPEIKTELVAGIFRGRELLKEINTGITAQQLWETKDYQVVLNLENIPAGKYDLQFSIRSKDYPPTHNSEKMELVIQ